MTPYHQTRFTSLDRTVIGNCMRTALGALLDVDPAEVPAFEAMPQAWHQAFFDFLIERGCVCAGMAGKRRDESVETWWARLRGLSPGVDGYYIVNGPSTRAHVTNGHSVLYRDGVLVHDPHPSGDGLAEIWDAYLIEPISPGPA